MLTFFQQLAQLLAQAPLVLATVTQVRGSAPRDVGAMMAVGQHGEIIGTIGGGAGEAKVLQRSQQVLATGVKAAVEIDLSGSTQHPVEGVCGGMMQVWLERWQGEAALHLIRQILDQLRSGQPALLVLPLEQSRSPYLQGLNSLSTSPLLTVDAFSIPLYPPPTLLIIGAGHCAVPLAHLAHVVGFRVVVQDDRPDFARSERFPDAAMVLSTSVEEVVNKLVEGELYAALVTRGYVHDLNALQVLSRMPLNYIGMIGSAKRVQTVLQALQQNQPVAETFLKTIYAPIGLDIGAQTPEEIAVSICAELIRVRRGGTGRSLSERFQQKHSLSIHSKGVNLESLDQE